MPFIPGNSSAGLEPKCPLSTLESAPAEEHVIQVGQFARLPTWNNTLSTFSSDEGHSKRARAGCVEQGCSAPGFDGDAEEQWIRTNVAVKIFVILGGLGLYDPQHFNFPTHS